LREVKIPFSGHISAKKVVISYKTLQACRIEQYASTGPGMEEIALVAAEKHNLLYVKNA
jgi:hypothetical protein